MFSTQTYIDRRDRLRRSIGSGLLLFLGNDESPMNYRANAYPFRQDSSFLYFFGLDRQGLAAVIDIDESGEVLFGDDSSVEDIVWTGPQPLLGELGAQAGVRETRPLAALDEALQKARAQGRAIHFLPPYRAEHVLWISRLLDIAPDEVKSLASAEFIKGVVAQRSIKSAEEVAQIESAHEITYAMHRFAMATTKPGMAEWLVSAALENIALMHGARLAFPTIFSTRGETLHVQAGTHAMRKGDLVVNDSAAESPLHYASDVTRTLPIGGRFSQRQREIYAVVLNAQQVAIEAIAPGVEYREVHRLAARAIAAGLKDAGLIKGDPDEAVEAGAHTLFFPHGIGHMLGLDVHDMESLGEDYVGYSETVRRNPAFGWKHLRLAKALEPGYVVTVEPGIYFIPPLIEHWRAERRCADFLVYARIEQYKDFGGVRIEDDVLVTDDGHRVLGEPIPKEIEEVEALMA